jgi:AGCS family alanine or glycine:cation symporter
LAIVVTGSWTSGENGAALTSLAFSHALPLGNYIVAIALAIFAFTTILGWSFYSEKCVQYLFGDKAVKPFRLIFTLVVPIGAISSLEFIWLLADTLNAMMALPNLIALMLLSPVVFGLTREYFAKQKALKKAL